MDCASQEEVDFYWGALSEGGAEGQCGWLKDKYGLSWHIVPARWVELLNDPDPAKLQRVVGLLAKSAGLIAVVISARNSLQHNGFGTGIVQASQRHTGQPEHGPGAEPAPISAHGFQLYLAGFHDDERIAPLGLVIRPRRTRRNRDRPRFERRPQPTGWHGRIVVVHQRIGGGLNDPNMLAPVVISVTGPSSGAVVSTVGACHSGRPRFRGQVRRLRTSGLTGGAAESHRRFSTEVYRSGRFSVEGASRTAE